MNTYKIIHKKIHEHIFTTTYICNSIAFIIHTFDTLSNVETHLGKTTKVLFIWHERYMAPLVCALSDILYSRSLFFIYTYFLLLSCSLIFYSLLSFLSILMICTQYGSTQLSSTLLCTQLQVLQLFSTTQQLNRIKTIQIKLSLNEQTLLILTSIYLLEANPHTSQVPPFIGPYMSLSIEFIQLADMLSFLFY